MWDSLHFLVDSTQVRIQKSSSFVFLSESLIHTYAYSFIHAYRFTEYCFCVGTSACIVSFCIRWSISVQAALLLILVPTDTPEKQKKMAEMFVTLLSNVGDTDEA